MQTDGNLCLLPFNLVSLHQPQVAWLKHVASGHENTGLAFVENEMSGQTASGEPG